MTEKPSGDWRLSKEKIGRWLTSDNARKVLVLAGLLGMALLLLSCLSERKSAATAVPTTDSAASYTAEMEEKLRAMILCVDGVSDCRVMVTLESGGRTVYASGGKTPLTECEPTVRGVVVMVGGVPNEETEAAVREVVKTALHLAEKRVCVVVNTHIENLNGRKGE